MHKNNRLLACGVIAGPLFIVTVVVQALARHGFDLTKQAASLLTLGGAGWIQSANFLLTGALMLACATGLKRVLDRNAGGTWAPRLMYVAGAGLMAGGVFHPDAGDGFPPGTPSGQSVVRSWHGVLHMVSGFSAFVALIVVCFVLARHFRAAGSITLARLSRVNGAVFAVCVVAANAPDGSLTLFVGASVVFVWIAFVARYLIGQSPRRRRSAFAVEPQPIEQVS
jgi:Protein of unknown function (DUF998)